MYVPVCAIHAYSQWLVPNTVGFMSSPVMLCTWCNRHGICGAIFFNHAMIAFILRDCQCVDDGSTIVECTVPVKSNKMIVTCTKWRIVALRKSNYKSPQ